MLLLCISFTASAAVKICNQFNAIKYTNIPIKQGSTYIWGGIEGNAGGTLTCTYSLASPNPKKIAYHGKYGWGCKYKLSCGGAEMYVYTNTDVTNAIVPTKNNPDDQNTSPTVCVFLTDTHGGRVNIANFERCKIPTNADGNGSAYLDYRTY